MTLPLFKDADRIRDMAEAVETTVWARKRKRAGRKAREWLLAATITVVLFAGMGGSSDGIERAGYPVHIANNHDVIAIATHQARHPHTQHEASDVRELCPLEVLAGRLLGRLWASPDCTHFSSAKGAMPVSKAIRSLPWIVVRWLGQGQPEELYVENVSEIRSWGRLVAQRDKKTGRVVKLDGTVAEKGERVPVRLQRLVPDRRVRRHRVNPAYVTKRQRAAGVAPNGVKRLRKSGRRIRGAIFAAWLKHIRRYMPNFAFRDLVAADYGIHTTRKRFYGVGLRSGLPVTWPTITHAAREMAASKGLLPRRPASEIIDWSRPMRSIFGRKKALAEATLARIAHNIVKYVVKAKEPFIVPITHSGPARDGRGQGVSEPFRTFTTARGGEFMLVAPALQKLSDLPDNSCAVVDLIGKHVGQDVVAENQAQARRRAGGKPGPDVISLGSMVKLRGTSVSGQSMHEPAPCITAAGNHEMLVAALLVKYYGEGGQGQDLREPMHTLTTKARLALVTVIIDGETYAIVDILIRMITPDEAAAAQGFAKGSIPDYVTIMVNGVATLKKLTIAEKMALVGNSVCPEMARLLVAAQAANDNRPQQAAPRRYARAA